MFDQNWSSSLSLYHLNTTINVPKAVLSRLGIGASMLTVYSITHHQMQCAILHLSSGNTIAHMMEVVSSMGAETHIHLAIQVPIIANGVFIHFLFAELSD